MSGISNHYDTMTFIQTTINGLALSGNPSIAIQEVAVYQDGDSRLPFISISPYGPEELQFEFTSIDGVHYPTLVAIVAAKDVTSLEQRLGWRQSMRRALNNKSAMATIQGNVNLVVKPGNVVEPRAFFDRKVFVSGFIVMAEFQETRL